jgi:hypothetical protein
LTPLDEIITQRKAKCVELEWKIDQLDDELYNQYIELEYFEEKKQSQIQTTFDGYGV